MNKYRNTPKDIHLRIYNFIVNCFRDVIKRIPKSTENLPIINQISASLTSVGANDQETDAAASKRDFLSKYVITRKETKETKYWLTLISDTAMVKKEIVNPYITECGEILMIISKIIENTKK